MTGYSATQRSAKLAIDAATAVRVNRSDKGQRLPTSDQALLIEFERQADNEAIALVEDKSIRSVVTLLFGAAAVSALLGDRDPNLARFRGWPVNRIGYLLPLISKAETVFRGSSGFDTIGAWGTDQETATTTHLFGYGALCETAPFAHKGAYNIRRLGSTLHLTWRSDAFGQFEARDVLMSHISSPLAAHDPREGWDWLANHARARQVPNLHQTLHYVQRAVPWFVSNFFEISPLSEAAMHAAVGVNLDEFRRFRAATLGLAQLYTILISATLRLSGEDEAWARESADFLFDCAAPVFDKASLEGFLAMAAGIPLGSTKALMKVFSTEGGDKEARGEGFVPPYVGCKEEYVFGPAVAQHMMGARNILYSMLKRDQVRFDEFVSAHLEPQLIVEAVELIERLSNVRIFTNVKWESGEIDILVFRQRDNMALLIEAKAAVPADGARMVRNTESRVSEGLAQISKFAGLTQAEKDQVCSNAVGRKVEGIEFASMLIAWAGFGSQKVWSDLNGVALVNIACLATLTERHRNDPLCRLPELANKLVDEIVAVCNPRWETETSTMGNLSIESPGLVYDAAPLARYRAAPHKAKRMRR